MQHVRASLPYKQDKVTEKNTEKRHRKNNTDRNRRTTGMLTQFARTELLLGKEAMEKLKKFQSCGIWSRRSGRLCL